VALILTHRIMRPCTFSLYCAQPATWYICACWQRFRNLFMTHNGYRI